MEDFSFMHQFQDMILTGVLDGHGGPEVSCYVSRVFHQELQKDPYFSLKNYHRSLANTFKKVDEIIISEEGER